MSWAAKRRLFVLLVLGAFLAALAALVLIATLHHTPTCTDGIQNQGEDGVDCGGPCAYLCTALEEPPTVLFSEPVTNGSGRTDVAALIENKNANASAKDVPYTVALYDATHTLVQSISGTLELPPGATVPVYVPGVATGSETVTAAFLSIDAARIMWVRSSGDTRTLPTVSNTVLTHEASAPVITAILTNPSTTPLEQVRVVAFVRDALGNVIAATQTVVPGIPSLGSATATFTWNAPFSGTAVSTQVFPVIPLP